VEKKEKIFRNAKDVLKIFKKGSIVSSVDQCFVYNVQKTYIQWESLLIIVD
jgi:hypothetical protein